LRIDEQQSYDRDYHYRGASVADVGHLSTSNSSEGRIHLMVSWKVINIFCWCFMTKWLFIILLWWI